MSAPSPISTDAPLLILDGPPSGKEDRALVEGVIEDARLQAANIGYSIAGVKLQPIFERRRENEIHPLQRLIIALSPNSAWDSHRAAAVNWTQIQHSLRSQILPLSTGNTNVIACPSFALIQQDNWNALNTVVEPRGPLQWAVERGFQFSDGAPTSTVDTSNLHHAAFNGNEKVINRRPPRLGGPSTMTLVEKLRAFCHENGHSLEYVGADHENFAIAVIQASKEAVLDIACRTPAREWYSDTHKLLAFDGKWLVQFRVTAFTTTPGDLYMPRVLVPPMGQTEALFRRCRQIDLATQPSYFGPAFSGADRASIFEPARAATINTLALRAQQMGMAWITQQTGRVPNPLSWVNDLAAQDSVGTILASMIRHEEVADADKAHLVHLLRHSDLFEFPNLTENPRTQFEHCLATTPPAEPGHNHAVPRQPIKVPSNEFRL